MCQSKHGILDNHTCFLIKQELVKKNMVIIPYIYSYMIYDIISINSIREKKYLFRAKKSVDYYFDIKVFYELKIDRERI